jgi:ATP-binding cassette subfamily B protein
MFGAMKLLLSYLRQYWKLVVLALFLAAINQIFSLLDPFIFRHVIDEYATRYQEYTTAQFFKGVSLLLAAAIGVAFVSRVAKNFQDYFINVIVQRMGAQIYSDGLRHSLELPYSVFEDQRSGETLGKLQKVRTDVEKLTVAFDQYRLHLPGWCALGDGVRAHRSLGDCVGLLHDGPRAGSLEFRVEP